MNVHAPIWDAVLPSEAGVLRALRLGDRIGARRLAASLYEIGGGAVVSPLHFHHANEEMLVVLRGTPSVRRSAQEERALREGDVEAFPTRPAGTHQILNRSAEPALVLVVATNDLPEVAEQVEEDRLAVITQDGLRLLPASEPLRP